MQAPASTPTSPGLNPRRERAQRPGSLPAWATPAGPRTLAHRPRLQPPAAETAGWPRARGGDFGLTSRPAPPGQVPPRPWPHHASDSSNLVLAFSLNLWLLRKGRHNEKALLQYLNLLLTTSRHREKNCILLGVCEESSINGESQTPLMHPDTARAPRPRLVHPAPLALPVLGAPPLSPDWAPRLRRAGRQQLHYVSTRCSGKKPLCSRIIIDILTFVTSFYSS